MPLPVLLEELVGDLAEQEVLLEGRDQVVLCADVQEVQDVFPQLDELITLGLKVQDDDRGVSAEVVADPGRTTPSSRSPYDRPLD